jgi:hypothetical protein
MGGRLKDVVVFLGPTLTLDEARAALDARYLPPIRQGDLYRVVRGHAPRIVAIIDGYFHFAPSVWHREILWALSQGVHVLGAGSMGALRAAELCDFGMRGVGTIFEAYRAGHFPPYRDPFDADDEVAVIHAPAEVGYAPLSDALVDMRETLAAAAAGGIIGAETRDRLVHAARATFYQERSYDRLLDQAEALSIGADDAARLRDWLPDNRILLKRRDALELLRLVATMAAGAPEPFRASFRFERASVWERFRSAVDQHGAADLSEAEQIALAEARLDPAVWRAARRQAARREAALREAELRSPQVSEDDTSTELSILRRSAGLLRRADLEAWMRTQALDAAGLARLMAEEALLRTLEPAVAARAVIDQLRLDGTFAALVSRGRDKQARLAGIDEARRTPSSLEAAALLATFVEESLGLDEAADAPSLAAELGYADEASMLAALWQERLYQRSRRPDLAAGKTAKAGP